MKGLCTKTGLVKSLRRYYKHNLEAVLKQYTVYDSTPTTFVLTAGCQDSELSGFLQRFRELETHQTLAASFDGERVPAKHCKNNIWIVKPAAENQGSIRAIIITHPIGRGIEVFQNNLPEMKWFLQSKSPNTQWIVQKYVERPLLYNGRKFDIRIWAVATWKRDFYFYRSGYVRTSSHVYDPDSQLNYVHLTNNCLQQLGDKYGAFEDGNTLGYEKFAVYLAKQFPSLGIDFERDLLERMKDLMIDTYLATKHDLNPGNRPNSFELLGYDFLIDEDFRVWLIEVNTNPYLGIPNKYIEGVMPKMLNDLLELVLDPHVPPANRAAAREVPNQFELLYSQRKGISQRRGFEVPLYPFAELDPGRVASNKERAEEEDRKTTPRRLAPPPPPLKKFKKKRGSLNAATPRRAPSQADLR